jgi:hypothetical protein
MTIDELTELYTHALSETSFSITGYRDIETEVNDFFERLSRCVFVKRIQFSFLMGGFLKVKNAKTWEVEDFKSIYCNTLTDCDKPEILSFYFYLNYRAKKIKEGTANVLSKLFCEDLDFRVSITNEATPSFTYKHHELLCDLMIPRSIFNEKFNPDGDNTTFRRKFIEIFNDIFKENEEHFVAEQIRGIRGKENVIRLNKSIVDLKEANEKYEVLYEAIFDKQRAESISATLFEEIKRKNVRKGLPFIQNAHTLELVRELIISSVALSFLCMYFDVKIEYMMSIGNVEERVSGGRIYRNMGGLIVAYKSSKELDIRDRVMLNMISDRLTSVVAGDYLRRKIDVIKEREAIIAFWRNKTLSKFKKAYIALVESDDWKQAESEISQEASLIWKKFIEGKVDDNYTYLIQTDPGSRNIEYSYKAPIKDFLIVRRIIFACEAFKIDCKQCYLLFASHPYPTRKGNENVVNDRTYKKPAFLSSHGIWTKDDRRDLPPLPEEQDWLNTLK